MRRSIILSAAAVALLCSTRLLSQSARRYTGADGGLRVALAQQLYSPNATVPRPRTMAEGGIQPQLASLGARCASTRRRSRPRRTRSTVNRMILGAVRGVKAREAK